MTKGPSQIERLQAGILRANEDGVRQGECNGACSAVRRFLNDRGLLAELSGRAIVADLVRRFGADYVRTFVDRYQLGELANRGPGSDPVSSAELASGDANSPEGVGAKGDPGGWTDGQVEPPDPDPNNGAEIAELDPFDTDEGP